MWNVRKSNLRIFRQRQRSNLSGWGAVFALLTHSKASFNESQALLDKS